MSSSCPTTAQTQTFLQQPVGEKSRKVLLSVRGRAPQGELGKTNHQQCHGWTRQVQLLLPPSYHIYGVSVTPSQDMKLDLQTLKTKDPWKLFCFVGAQLISLYIIKHLQHYDSYLHSRWSEPSIITRHIPLLYLVEVHQKKPTLDISDGDKKSIKPSGMSDSRRR